MRMTLHEVALIGIIMTILLVGAFVKHYRDRERVRQPGTTATTPKPTPAQPPYVKLKKR